MQIKAKRLYPDAILPVKATRLASGFDLHAYEILDVDDFLEFQPSADTSFDRYTIYPGERVFVRTGIAVEIPLNCEGQIRPRSGLALKHGITVVNTPGTIDADYTGEIGVVLLNTGDHALIVTKGERIAQIVFSPVLHNVELIEDEISQETDRGAGGFGHTGTN